jgi:hypothetical protein
MHIAVNDRSLDAAMPPDIHVGKAGLAFYPVSEDLVSDVARAETVPACVCRARTIPVVT